MRRSRCSIPCSGARGRLILILTGIALIYIRASSLRGNYYGSSTHMDPTETTSFLPWVQTTVKSTDQQPLKTTAEIIDQRYCRNSERTYFAILKLRMQFFNSTDRNLILEKTLGQRISAIAVASDTKNLSENRYEHSPNGDWFVERFPPEKPEQFKSPGPDFLVLPPGESIKVEREIRALPVAAGDKPEEFLDSLRPGNHVLRLSISTWDFKTNPQEIRQRWEPIGYLIYDSISTGPLPFSIPSDPRLLECKNLPN
jgi:hypothetical protein